MIKPLDLDKNKKYLLACSFGPDSMALFHMLKVQGYNFMVAHVNYNVRPEAKYETDTLNAICAQNDIEIEIYSCKFSIFSGNFESKARDIRYNFFKEIYYKNNIDALLVAHQQDDVIETYFLQQKRGGYFDNFGIVREVKVFDMITIRPLLDYSKQELLQYCLDNHVPYAIDSSNSSDDFSRNVIRHNIVSKMSQSERENTINEINSLNQNIAAINKKLASLNLNDKATLLKLNDEEFQRALVFLARQIKQDASISSKLSEEIKKILISEKPNVYFKVSNNLIFNKEYDWVSFIKDEKTSDYSYVLQSPGKLETQYFYLDFTNGHGDKKITLDDYPLTIRNAKEDDEIRINNYVCRARRLFIDWKMPLSVRKKWPVIVNKSGTVIYIPRYRKNFKLNDELNFYVKM